jgi:hypothetical protein
MQNVTLLKRVGWVGCALRLSLSGLWPNLPATNGQGKNLARLLWFQRGEKKLTSVAVFADVLNNSRLYPGSQ